MTPATAARLVVERAGDLIAAQIRGEVPAAPTIDMVLAHPPVADAIARCGGLPGRQVILLAALAAGRSVIGFWRLAYPDLTGPPDTLDATESWAAEPTDAAADAAERAADRAIRESLVVWRGPDRAAAWAGRTAAWVGMAPKYGWPAVAALSGACEAGGAEPVVAAVGACLTELWRGRAEPSAAADPAR